MEKCHYPVPGPVPGRDLVQQAYKTNADKGFLLSKGYDGTWFYRQRVMFHALKKIF
jgi:hypothetical protein